MLSLRGQCTRGSGKLPELWNGFAPRDAACFPIRRARHAAACPAALLFSASAPCRGALVPQPARSCASAAQSLFLGRRVYHLGFASSVIGYFWASLVLLPLGLVTSLIGFKGNKTRALAVAGIVVSAIGLLIKLMMILNDASWLPYWITNGIW